MAEIERTALFGRLSPTCYKALEAATVHCKLRGNAYVEISHWIHQLVEKDNSDLHRIVRAFEMDPAKLAADLTKAMDQLPRGATSISDLSSHLQNLVKEGWLYASLLYRVSKVRSGHLIVAALKTPELRMQLLGISGEFQKVKLDLLSDDFDDVTGGSVEALEESSDESYEVDPGEASGSMAPAEMGKAVALKKYTTDLTELAKSGKMDPIIGRDDEIRQVADILSRRRQNNPILTGEAGVGKTAVVEGFAQKIVEGLVPSSLANVSIKTLDIGLLQAGASMKGEFENRLKQVIEEVQSSPKPIILFIDEAHTLIGAGGAAGQGDAANLLKPALARGDLRTIAATTWSEYKKYIEKDPALTRRFQVVKVEEPAETVATEMLRGVSSKLQEHHNVSILDEALDSAVKLSHRYIPSRQLPDKAVSLLDTTCARVSISLYSKPAPVERLERRLEALNVEEGILGRESSIGLDRSDRLAGIVAERAEIEGQLAEVNAQWEREKALVERIHDISTKLENPDENGEAPSITELESARKELQEIQGETPLMSPSVDAQSVASVVSDWTGIPVGRMVRNEIEQVITLPDILEKRIIGQRHALEAISKRIQTARARLDHPSKPIGVFLLAGTSGVGKTETALALAETLYGGESNLITINMSEFQEAHTVSTLKGSPPGYVGYGEGGVLTEAVRRKPYSVVLLDEVEKAHSDVHEIFFQVFDKGVMEDSEGRQIDFKNTIILLTTNAGSDLLMNMCKDPDLMPNPEALAEALRTPLLEVFPAALLGRLVTIPYYPLTDDMLKLIIEIQLERVERRFLSNHGAAFKYDDRVVDLILSRCQEVESGGRMIDAILTQTLLPDLSQEILSRMMDGEQLGALEVTAENDQFKYEFGGPA